MPVDQPPLTPEQEATEKAKYAAISDEYKREQSLAKSRDEIMNDGALVYPEHNQDRYQAFIKFTPREIQPPELPEALLGALKDGVTSATTTVKESIEGGTVGTDAVAGGLSLAGGIGDLFGALANGIGGIGDLLQDAGVFGDSKGVDLDGLLEGSSGFVANDSPNRFKDRTQVSGEPITLYLPTALTFNDGLSYDTSSALGVAGGAAFNVTSAGGGVTDIIKEAANVSFKSLSDMGRSANSQDLARLGVMKLVSKGNAAGGEGMAIAAGVTVNPNVRASFKGVAIREFAFTFKFIPKSQRESEIVEKMIRRFRYAAYPETIGSSETGGTSDVDDLASIPLGYRFPDLFDIVVGYKTEGGTKVQVGHKFLKCFLKGVSTNFNPSSMSFHADGKPVEIDLTLNFVEEKTLDRKAIAEGY